MNTGKYPVSNDMYFQMWMVLTHGQIETLRMFSFWSTFKVLLTIAVASFADKSSFSGFSVPFLGQKFDSNENRQ